MPVSERAGALVCVHACMRVGVFWCAFAECVRISVHMAHKCVSTLLYMCVGMHICPYACISMHMCMHLYAVYQQLQSQNLAHIFIL